MQGGLAEGAIRRHKKLQLAEYPTARRRRVQGYSALGAKWNSGR